MVGFCFCLFVVWMVWFCLVGVFLLQFVLFGFGLNLVYFGFVFFVLGFPNLVGFWFCLVLV